MMEEPRSCVLLPDAKLLILDLKLGLTLMDLQSKETKRCAPDDNWRDVESACYMKKHNQILVRIVLIMSEWGTHAISARVRTKGRPAVS